MVCRRQWYKRLLRELHDLGFTRSHHHHAIFFKREGDKYIICAIYIDDMLIAGNDIPGRDRLKAELSKRFENDSK